MRIQGTVLAEFQETKNIQEAKEIPKMQEAIRKEPQEDKVKSSVV